MVLAHSGEHPPRWAVMVSIHPETVWVPRAMLMGADRVFTAATADEVMPVSRVNGRTLSNDRTGPTTLQKKELYWRTHAKAPHAPPVREESKGEVSGWIHPNPFRINNTP